MWEVTYIRRAPVESRLTLEWTNTPRDYPMEKAIGWAECWGELELPGWELTHVARPRA